MPSILVGIHPTIPSCIQLHFWPGLQLPLFLFSLLLPSSPFSFLWLSTFKNMSTTSIAYFLSHKLPKTKLTAESPGLRDCPPPPNSARSPGVQAQHIWQCLVLGLLPTPSRDTGQSFGVHEKGQVICTQTRGKSSKGTAITKEDGPWHGLSVYTTEGTDTESTPTWLAGRPFPPAYQSIGHGLLSLIQVHEVVIVTRVHVHGHAGYDGEQETFVVPWK